MNDDKTEPGREAMLETLMVKGVLFDLDAHTWTGVFTLTAEDLGFSRGEVDRELMDLGKGWLAPRRRINALKAILLRATKTVYSMGVPFPIYGTHYVPVTNLRKLDAALTETRIEFQKEVDEFCKDWEAMRTDTVSRWLKWAENAYDKTARIRKEFDSREHFLTAFKARIEKKMPTAGEIAGSFSLEWRPFQIVLPSNFRLKTVDVDEAEAKLASFDKYSRLWSRRVEDFCKDSVKIIRERVAEVATEVSKIFSESGSVKGPSLRRLKDVVEEVRSLNFIGDADLDGKLNELADLAGKLQEARSDGIDGDPVVMLGRALGGVADMIRKESAEAAERATLSFGELGKRALEV